MNCYECENNHPSGIMINMNDETECPECGKIINVDK